jgi:hypothetical protein
MWLDNHECNSEANVWCQRAHENQTACGRRQAQAGMTHVRFYSRVSVNEQGRSIPPPKPA